MSSLKKQTTITIMSWTRRSSRRAFQKVFKTKLDEMMENAPKDFEIKEDTGDEGGFFKSAGDYVDKGKLEKEYYAKQRLNIVNECHEQLKQKMRDILINKTERKRIAKELIENVRKDAEKEVANAVEIANAERTKVKAQIAEKKAKAEAEAKKQAEKEAAEAAAAAEAAKKEAEKEKRAREERH